MSKADLHIHTTASDGRFSPQEILAAAKAAGLSTIALTDHDTIDGLLQLIESPSWQKSSVKMIPGIEFSTDVPNHEIHILGYHIHLFHEELTRQLKLLVDDRIVRAQKMIGKLSDLGYFVSYERVLEIAGDGTAIGRPHIARALLEKKYFSTISEVFDKVLHTNGPAYVSHYKMTPQEAIDLIHQSGGIAVIAHPAMVYDDALVEQVIKAGIDGLEVYHPAHRVEDVKKYKKLAEEYGLLQTGGSDFHGIPGRFPEKLGIFMIEESLAEQLPVNFLNHSLNL
ncbi:MAG: PHP domain-containing protein [Sporomusaceae bacterium]|nr:PHP domain-containing protein [Sporomusaceae bacterium]